MQDDLNRLLAAIRAQPWAIMPEYLAAIEAIAIRAFEAQALLKVGADGHQERLAQSLGAVAAVGLRLEGSLGATQRDGAAVVPLLGPIFPRANMMNSSAGGTSLAEFMHDLRAADGNSSVDRIVMLVDSPGGVVSGLAEAAEGIRSLSKPVTAFVTGNGASAAYWLASQAREIVMDASAMVGSLGVMLSLSKQVQAGADGRMAFEIVSTGAPLKRADPETEEGRVALQAMVDAAEAVFFADVAKGRGVSVATVRNEFGRGGMVAARQAVEDGLADRIGTLEGVLSKGRPAASNGAGAQRARLSGEVQQRRRAAQ
ncbi:S49 family peptidase [Cereibacter sphaeroides]|nr:S49 family peptidase [Cereibacter sphaeroides]